MVLLDVSHKIEAKGVRFKHVLMFVVLLKLTPSCLQYAAIVLGKTLLCIYRLVISDVDRLFVCARNVMLRVCVRVCV